MELNADFSQRAVVHAGTIPWVPSPMAGVDRRMLDRMGDEVARATSIVRYAPGSAFSPHVHTGGEEYLVLEGVFQDEHGDFPVGSYVRNPPQSRHTPRAADGATILVKLWQFDPDDRTDVALNINDMAQVAVPGREGVKAIELHKDDHETVLVETWNPATRVLIDDHKGLEVFVIDGSFDEGGERFERHSWLRLPIGYALDAHAGPDGARVWIKRDHLAVPPKPPRL